jgi:hypothetical protein
MGSLSFAIAPEASWMSHSKKASFKKCAKRDKSN